jgi:hypothetical protein
MLQFLRTLIILLAVHDHYVISAFFPRFYLSFLPTANTSITIVCYKSRFKDVMHFFSHTGAIYNHNYVIV